MWRSRIRSSCALLIVGASAPAMAQNLLLNPGFAQDLAHWDPFIGFDITQEWSALDADGAPDSGSICGTLPASGTFRIPIYASQCVGIQPGTPYAFRGAVLLPDATTPASAYGTVFVNTYAATNCAGNPVQNIVAPEVTMRDAWTITGAGFTTGPAEITARVHLRVFAPAATNLHSCFDNTVLEPDRLFANGFD